MDAHRRQKATGPLDDAVAAPTSRVAAEALSILTVIRSLPQTYREPLIMRFVEGMTGPDARRTGMTSGSVRVNLHRGVKLLRSKLAVDRESQHHV